MPNHRLKRWVFAVTLILVVSVFSFLPLLSSTAFAVDDPDATQALTTSASAASASPDTGNLSNDIQELRPAQEGSMVFMYCPGLTWDNVIVGIEELQALGRSVTFLDQSGLANLSSPYDPGISSLLTSENVGHYVCADAGSASQTLTQIQDFIDTRLPQNSILVIGSTSLFNGEAPNTQFTPVIIYGEEHFGYLSSEITQRLGLITATDLVVLQEDLDKRRGVQTVTNVDSSARVVGSTLFDEATSNSTILRIDHLAKENKTIQSLGETKQFASLTFLAFVLASFTLSILLLILGRGERKGSRKLLIPTVRILWLIVLAYPAATFLMFLILPSRPSPAALIVAVLLWVMIISIAALIIGRTTKWVNSLITLFGLTIIVIVAGQIFSGPLASPGYMTYDITEGSRYYGMGNEQGAMLFGSWITLSGLLINRYPDAKWIPAFKKWGFLIGSVVLLFVATSPWMGASFGPLVWGSLGCFMCWWLLNGRRLRWWLVLLSVVAAFGIALSVLYADIALNPASHMNQIAPSANEGLFKLITQIASDVWNYSFALVRDNVPAVAIVFFVFVLILLVVLRVLQPGTYREFWQRNVAFRVAYSICFILAGITFIIEDSGIFTPAMLIVYPVAGFVWLICDLHSWHLRVLEEGGLPLSIKQLQQRALELLPHKDGSTPADCKNKAKPHGTTGQSNDVEFVRSHASIAAAAANPASSPTAAPPSPTAVAPAPAPADHATTTAPSATDVAAASPASSPAADHAAAANPAPPKLEDKK